MLLGAAARLRPRRPVALIAAWLIAMQAFVAGVAMARAAVVLASDGSDFAVTCHGNGGSDPDHGAVPDPIKAAHLCCVACGGPAAALAPAPIMPRPVALQAAQPTAFGAGAGPIGRRAVRDGPSQAPPTLA